MGGDPRRLDRDGRGHRASGGARPRAPRVRRSSRALSRRGADARERDQRPGPSRVVARGGCGRRGGSARRCEARLRAGRAAERGADGTCAQRRLARALPRHRRCGSPAPTVREDVQLPRAFVRLLDPGAPRSRSPRAGRSDPRPDEPPARFAASQLRARRRGEGRPPDVRASPRARARAARSSRQPAQVRLHRDARSRAGARPGGDRAARDVHSRARSRGALVHVRRRRAHRHVPGARRRGMVQRCDDRLHGRDDTAAPGRHPAPRVRSERTEAVAMDAIDTILQPEQLEMLRAQYLNADMINILSSGMPGLDERTTGYVNAIRQAFYEGSTMAPRDRERCLIAVLASRDAGLNLAIHIYIGLMEGLLPKEIADIIFLGGIYTGVDRISDGLAAEKRTLTVLAGIAVPPKVFTVPQVMQALSGAFTSPPPTSG